MPKDFYQALRITGTLHIIALSGTNITIIINVLGSIFIVFGRRLALVLTIFFIVLFVFFVGPSASVVRASLMGVISLIGIFFGRQTYSLLIFFVSAVLMLVFWPAWLFDIGFQLSCLATLGIILFTGHGGLSGRGLVRTLRADLKTTLAAQVFTLPILFFNFHQISFISPVTNLLVGWVVQPITILGLVIALCGWIFLPLGQILAWVAYPFLEYFILVVDLTSKVPGASITF